MMILTITSFEWILLIEVGIIAVVMLLGSGLRRP
jgi:hypothetical protein